MKTYWKNTSLARIVALMAMLGVSACGGGGGNDGGSGAPATPPVIATTTTTTLPATIVTSVVPATYTPGSARADAYTYLNAQRSPCGFGLLQQSPQIDVAAQSHADYTTSNQYWNHFESLSVFPSGFTGITPPDRMTAAGYPTTAAVAEVMGAPLSLYNVSAGKANVMDLLTAPYHGMAMLGSYRDVGVGFSTHPGGGYTNVLVMDFGATVANPVQLLNTTDVKTYPCTGTTGVLSRSYTTETPGPNGNRNTGTQPIGTPIYLKVRDGQTLVLTSTSLTKVGDSTSLLLILLSKATDPVNSNEFVDNSIVALMPDAPLATNTSYQFTATGTNNGQPFNTNFIFTTGAF